MARRGRRPRRTSLAARAAELGVHRSTLLRWCVDGTGPKAMKQGKRTYIVTDLEWERWKRSREAAVGAA